MVLPMRASIFRITVASVCRSGVGDELSAFGVLKHRRDGDHLDPN